MIGKLIGMAALALLAVPAMAQDGGVSDADMMAEWKEGFGEDKKAPTIPPALQPLISDAGPLRFTLKGLDGPNIIVETSYAEASDLEPFVSDRFIGFSELGYEYYGYVVVDRKMKGKDAAIQTGGKPSFSPDGRWMIAGELTESGYNGLEAIGMWEIKPDSTVPRMVMSVAPKGIQWRAEKWIDNRCGQISYIPGDWQAPDDVAWEEAVKTAPRMWIAIYFGDPVRVYQSYEGDGCVVEQ